MTRTHSSRPPSDHRFSTECREVVQMLGISERRLETLTYARSVPRLRVSAHVFYPVDALKQWIKDRTSSFGS